MIFVGTLHDSKQWYRPDSSTNLFSIDLKGVNGLVNEIMHIKKQKPVSAKTEKLNHIVHCGILIVALIIV